MRCAFDHKVRRFIHELCHERWHRFIEIVRLLLSVLHVFAWLPTSDDQCHCERMSGEPELCFAAVQCVIVDYAD